MIPMILLRTVTHDWGKRVAGEQVMLNEKEAAEFEERGLARRVYAAKAMPAAPENKASVVERIEAAVEKELEKPKPAPRPARARRPAAKKRTPAKRGPGRPRKTPKK